MSTYLGYYRPDPAHLQDLTTRARGGDPTVDPKLARLVVELPDKLPAGCKIVGAYNPMAGNVLSEPGPPGVLVVETTNGDDVLFISQYYTGYLQFQWMPARAVGATRQEREAAMAAAATPAGTRR